MSIWEFQVLQYCDPYTTNGSPQGTFSTLLTKLQCPTVSDRHDQLAASMLVSCNNGISCLPYSYNGSDGETVLDYAGDDTGKPLLGSSGSVAAMQQV